MEGMGTGEGNYGYGSGDVEGNDRRLLEGVGDEVTATFTTLILLCVPLGIFAWQNRHRALQTIHPASVHLVEQLRRTLGLHPQPPADPDAQAPEASAEGGGAEGPRVERVYSGDRTCPICFGEARFAVQTNCGHLFCAQCLLAYWDFTSPLSAVPCPVCRRPVSLLLPSFSEADPEQEGRAEMEGRINAYNRRFSGAPRTMMDYLRDVPILLPHLIRELFTFNGLMVMFRFRVLVCLIGAVLYVLSPLDIVPEAVFGVLGIFDDLFVVFILALYVTAAYRHFVANRND